MIFLIDYDRKSGSLVDLRTFNNSEREKAQDARLALELKLNRGEDKERGSDREIVLLEAENEEAIRKTHRRYFERIEELASSLHRALSG